MKPNTYPAEPLDTLVDVRQAVPVKIPKDIYEGDWLVDMDNDIDYLEHHFQCSVGDYLWLAEPHKLHLKTDATDPNFKEVWVDYDDAEKKKTMLLPEEVRFWDRRMPPLAMKKLASRLVFKVREIGVKWDNPEKRTQLYWIVGLERVPSADYVFELERRGALK